MCESLVLFFAALCGVFFTLWRRERRQARLWRMALHVTEHILARHVPLNQFRSWAEEFKKEQEQ